MKNKIVGICLLDENDEVLKTIKLKTHWNQNEVNFFSKCHGLKIEDAVANMIYVEIRNNLKIEDIKELLSE
jgi:hypothetical protein